MSVASKLRKDAQLLAEEEVAASKQTFSLLDSDLQRLNADLQKFNFGSTINFKRVVSIYFGE